jgi:uncharacterized protein YdaU (DUF1376 family)
MMAEFPHMPLATDAYLGDTQHLSTIEHGAYLLLLMAMWRAGGQLPNDAGRLARIAKVGPQQWNRIAATLMRFMTIVENGAAITQGRLVDEMTAARERSKTAAENARSRWRTRPAVKRQLDPSFNDDAAKSLEIQDVDDADALQRQSGRNATIPIPSSSVETSVSTVSETAISDASKSRKRNSYPADFEDAWRAYPTDPNMSKLKAFKAWKQLPTEDRPRVMASMPGFTAYCRKDPTYRVVHMERFIRERRFDGYLEAATPVSHIASVDVWQKRLTYGRRQHIWSTAQWGPMPGCAGCLAPADLLEPEDGSGWSEQSKVA